MVITINKKVIFFGLLKFYYYICFMKDLIIIRGLPGSGKSTLGEMFGGTQVEADMYFINPTTEEYKFDSYKIKDAHQWCQNTVKELMRENCERIVVSNTFTQEWEMEKYRYLAQQYGYTIFTLITENRHQGVNQHNVPVDKVKSMKDRFQIKL